MTWNYFLYTIFSKITKYSHFHHTIHENFVYEELFRMSSQLIFFQKHAQMLQISNITAFYPFFIHFQHQIGFIEPAKNHIIFRIFNMYTLRKFTVFSGFFQFPPSISRPRYLLLFFNAFQHVNMTISYSQISYLTL